MVEIGKKIRELRLEKNLTQIMLARKLNIANNTISQYENGLTHPALETVVAIAGLFDVSADYLLGIDDSLEHARKKFLKHEKLLNELNDGELSAVLTYIKALIVARKIMPASPIQKIWREMDEEQREELMRFAEGLAGFAREH